MQKWEYLKLVLEEFGEKELIDKGLRKKVGGAWYGLDEGWYWLDYVGERQRLSKELTSLSDQDWIEFLTQTQENALGVNQRLNLLGSQGWEGFSTVYYQASYSSTQQEFYFKRPLEG